MSNLVTFAQSNPMFIGIVLGAILIYKLLTSNDWGLKLFGVGILLAALRLFTLATAIAIIFTMTPTTAYACDSWLCLGDTFGWTDVAKVHSDRDQQLANIQAKQAQDVARINADAQARIAEANRQIEAQRIQGQISAMQAKAMADAFAASVNAKRDEYVAALTQNAQVAIAGLNNAANISIAGVNQTGETERSRIAWDGKGNMLAIVIIGLVVLGALAIVGRILIIKTQATQAPPNITVMLANPYSPQRTLDAPQQTYLPRQSIQLIGDDHEQR